MTRVNIIAVVSRGGGLGWDGKLLYDIPRDLIRFKTITFSHTCVMGRKTWESLPENKLPGRRMIVLSHHDLDLSKKGAEVAHSMEEVFKLTLKDKEIFVIGGGTLFRDTIDLASKVYLTKVDDSPEHCDTWFPMGKLYKGFKKGPSKEWEDEGYPKITFTNYYR